MQDCNPRERPIGSISSSYFGSTFELENQLLPVNEVLAAVEELGEFSTPKVLLAYASTFPSIWSQRISDWAQLLLEDSTFYSIIELAELLVELGQQILPSWESLELLGTYEHHQVRLDSWPGFQLVRMGMHIRYRAVLNQAQRYLGALLPSQAPIVIMPPRYELSLELAAAELAARDPQLCRLHGSTWLRV